jgi:hypothetical protein
VGETLGEPVGGSVFKIQRFESAELSSSRVRAWIGGTRTGGTRFLAGLLSILNSAEPTSTLDSSPMPIANRSTPRLSKAAISESYWVTAS